MIKIKFPGRQDILRQDSSDNALNTRLGPPPESRARSLLQIGRYFTLRALGGWRK